MRVSSSLAFLMIFSIAGVCSATQQVQISGKVLDEENRAPLMANVVVSGTGKGTVAKPDGSFSLVFKSDSTEFEVRVFLIGYEPKRLRAKSGDYLEILLKVQPIPLSEVVVTPEAIVGTDSPEKIVAINKIEIYRTPGAAADPLYAIQMLPGVNAPPDASSILIQGGAANEVLYLLDGIEVGHPFQVEAGDVSYFSVFDTEVVKRNQVTTAGFSSKYGNALSGVVDLKTEGNLNRASGAIGLHMVGGNAVARLPLRWGQSLVASYRSVKSGLMEKVYGSDGTYGGDNIFLSLQFPLTATTSIRLIGLEEWYRFDRKGSSAMHLDSDNKIAGIVMNGAWGSTVNTTTLSLTSYSADYRSRKFDVGIDDDRVQIRSDWIRESGGNLFQFGFDWSRRSDGISKRMEPFVDSLFESSGNRFGAYITSRSQLSRGVFLEYGLRSSTLDLLSHKLFWEPRLSIAYFVTSKDVLRFSTGIYRQFGDYWFTKHYSLQPMRAYHYCLTFDHIGQQFTGRVTAYDKRYRGLMLYDGDHVNDSGRGYARGLEFYAKVDFGISDFRVVYNFLDSKRREKEITYLAPSEYGIEHSLSVSSSIGLFGIALGSRYSFQTGLPYTPLIRVEIDGQTGEPIPVWGEFNSARCPSYHRFDISITRIVNLGNLRLVIFVSGNNITNRRNIVGYEFDENYEKREIEAIFRRAFVAGVHFSFKQ